MTDRAVSTVLDTSVSLLLVAVAVLTLLTAQPAGPDPADGRAEEVATTLAGATAAVEYETSRGTRTVHGTQAGLLADAAVSNRSPTSGGRFRSAVANATRPTLVGPDWRAQVVATWRPYDGAGELARVRVGDVPPADVDVHAASMTVPSGLDPVRDDARVAAERDGFEGVAAVVAEAVAGTGADRSTGTVDEAEIGADLTSTFDDPTAAADAISVGRVHVSVRTWSP